MLNKSRKFVESVEYFLSTVRIKTSVPDSFEKCLIFKESISKLLL